jgi:tetrahydromethanopterin S-methyltransferase subunit E
MLLKKKCVAVGDTLFEYFLAHHLGRLVGRGSHFFGPLQVDLVDSHKSGIALLDLLGCEAIAQSVLGLWPQDALLFL